MAEQAKRIEKLEHDETCDDCHVAKELAEARKRIEELENSVPGPVRSYIAQVEHLKKERDSARKALAEMRDVGRKMVKAYDDADDEESESGHSNSECGENCPGCRRDIASEELRKAIEEQGGEGRP